SQMNGTPMAAWPAHFSNDITAPSSTRRHGRMREPPDPGAPTLLRSYARARRATLRTNGCRRPACVPRRAAPRANAAPRASARALLGHGRTAHHQLARFGVHTLGAIAVDRLEDGPSSAAAQGLEVHVHARQLRAGAGG